MSDKKEIEVINKHAEKIRKITKEIKELNEAIKSAEIVIGRSKLCRSPKCNLTPFEQDSIQILIDFAREEKGKVCEH